MTLTPIGASFRDPSGFTYAAGGVVYRQVNPRYQPHYDRLMQSGLYDALARQPLMVTHAEVEPAPGAYRTLRPQQIPYISYPYEWCFSQIKDAALLTLDIQRLALAHGMTLKDASAYNVQFIGCRPIFIDTLSFETYEDGRPWVAYRQFCQHFLAPLALMAHADVRLRHLLRSYLDGVPLDLAAGLLPARTRLRPGLLAHLHVHARSQKRHEADARRPPAGRTPALPKSRFTALLDHLRATVQRLTLPRVSTEWGRYYEDTNYSAEAMAGKEAMVRRMLDEVALPGRPVHDFGANTGRFSRIAAAAGRYVVSHDIDEVAVDRNYLDGRTAGDASVLPLLLDLTNPSPAIGWALDERMSLPDRAAGGTALALALVHHLAISNNVPLPRLAAFFARIAGALVIEFVPKEDSQVQRLLATREDIFPDYTIDAFERSFSDLFEIAGREGVSGSARTLFAMRRQRA
jgi:hypothetical protein